jgi:exodeoxyribonuclease VII large subunit
VLSRGYALVYSGEGKLLRSAADTAAGKTVRARLAHGTIEAEVKQINIDEANVTEINNP